MKYSSTYLAWLKSEITEVDLGNGYTEITAPFLDRHNDYLQIYVKELENSMYRLSDDMYTITDLKMSGLDFNTPKRKQVLQDLILKRGIKYNIKSDELYLEVPKSALGEAQHQLFQAMLDINDLFYLNQTSIKTFFFEDVENFFHKNKIYFSKDIALKGKSGYTQSFDFLLQQNASHPERFIKLLSNPKRANIERFIFSWTDIKESRRNDSKLIVMINDQEKIKGISEHVQHLNEYGIQSVQWSEKDKHVELFA